MDNYVVYFLLGKVSEDRERLSRWPQWQQCLPLFEKLFAPYAKTARIKSYQVYEIPVSGGRVAFKKVPALTALKWNYDDHKKWSAYSSTTSSPYKVQHVETTIVSSKGKETPDICIFLDEHLTTGVDEYLYNQCFTLSVRERVHKAMPAANWDDMIARMKELFHAVRVGRTTRPWEIIKVTVDPVYNIPSRMESSLGFPHFTTRPVPMSLQFSEFFQTWTYIE